MNDNGGMYVYITGRKAFGFSEIDEARYVYENRCEKGVHGITGAVNTCYGPFNFN